MLEGTWSLPLSGILFSKVDEKHLLVVMLVDLAAYCVSDISNVTQS